jgi:transcription initiation factor TFIID subunit 9B
MLLASLGVTAYQERVPLQLLDFAYRYTSSALQDAVYLATEGYPGEPPHQKGHTGPDGSGGRAQHPSQDVNSVSLGALRMSIASRLHYQFQPGLPKEFLMDIAAERNRIMLPGVSRGHDGGAAATATASGTLMGGMRLPPERFCLTGVGWGLKEEWESEGEEEMDIDNARGGGPAGGRTEETDEMEDDEGDGRMEDVFGEGTLGSGGRDKDKAMTDV